MIDVHPINYKIQLEPDLNRFKFSGITEILIEAVKPVHEISLNILDLARWSCKVSVNDEFLECAFLADPKREKLRISLPNEMAGEINLIIVYEGEINDRMAGFYRSKYVTDGKEKYLAVTQFEESDARGAFPCFDHPVKKATFDIELIVDEEMEAISNSSITEKRSLGNGKNQ